MFGAPKEPIMIQKFSLSHQIWEKIWGNLGKKSNNIKYKIAKHLDVTKVIREVSQNFQKIRSFLEKQQHLIKYEFKINFFSTAFSYITGLFNCYYFKVYYYCFKLCFIPKMLFNSIYGIFICFYLKHVVRNF